jgi:hypothetical protein
LSAAPKYSTPRTPSRRTLGGQIAKIADALGKSPMPWQQHVNDIATELDDEGRLVYEIVLITVPRQSGKTTLVGPVQLQRVMTTRDVRCFYTAQTGKDARKRFEDLVNLMKSSPLDSIAHYRWSAGDEGISFPNGSALKLFAPTMDAIHGETPPLVTFDEIWKYDELLGDALLEGAVIPAQMTLAGRRQVWMISTAGTALSTFMRKWVERGRQSVEDRLAGRDTAWPQLAYFEWGLADGDDPYDPDAIARFHPAVGHTVTVEELLELSATVSRAEWLRAFCNVWLEASDPLFSAEEWNALAIEPEAVPSRRDLAMTYEIAADNSSGVVYASWRDVDGRPCTRVLHAAPGTTWMHGYIVKLYRDWKPAVLGADDGGPTRRLTDQLRRTLGDDAITTLGARDFGTASESLLDMIRTRELKHDGSQSLNNAIAHLVLKRYGDVTRFSRNDSTGPIAAIIAAAVGIWLTDHREVLPTTLKIHI